MDKKTNEISVKEPEEFLITETTIQNLIYVIRGQQVMLDKDLAFLYQVETGALNRAVKRNIKRFPESFCFQLSEEEYENLRCQIGISSLEINGYGGRRYLPYVFTEQGIAMLSAVLRSDVAIQVSIKIMNTSLKDAGKKCFAINKIEDRANIIDILDRIKKTDNGGTDDGRE